ncbi:leucine-rich_repeat domain-containing protein [Hexamita inflata]|uniref:Leucine-rich repeat domain-containing protein n=1 Tax=Hexamita inflata TaxID=28002 RepID=A0AA86U4D4_9EUKA|nr:leucine-rich repeat domain-containing protein [Hexamita inflata]
MINLTKVQLEDMSLTDISALRVLVNLQELILSMNKIKDIGHLARLTKLTKLEIERNCIISIAPLESLKNLQTLNIESNNIIFVDIIASFTQLRYLSISNNKIIDDSPIENNHSILEEYCTDQEDSTPQEIIFAQKLEDIYKTHKILHLNTCLKYNTLNKMEKAIKTTQAIIKIATYSQIYFTKSVVELIKYLSILILLFNFLDLTFQNKKDKKKCCQPCFQQNKLNELCSKQFPIQLLLILSLFSIYIYVITNFRIVYSFIAK